MTSDIEKEAKKLFKEVLNAYNGQPTKTFMQMVEDRLDVYNDTVKELMISNISSMLKKSLSGDITPYMIDSLSLSDKLYKNAQNVAKATQNALNEHLQRGSSIDTIRKSIYDGYNYGDKDILPLKKELPRYLVKNDKIEAMKRKTKPLKASYMQLLNSKNEKAFEKNMKLALYEKSRYYAQRIAETEKARSMALSDAKEFLEDDDIELVRFIMNGRHKITDICDYYANLNVGYGKGIVPKEQMVTLPLHPHCFCRYMRIPSSTKKKYKEVSNPEKQTINSFDEKEQISILGSREKLQRWRKGESAESIFNSIRPNYPIKKAMDELSTINDTISSMKKYRQVENNFINRLKDFDTQDIKGTFENLWNDRKSYDKHLRKRVALGDVVDADDYIFKTFATLDQKKAYYEHFKDVDVWDRVIYNQKLQWSVILGENGAILTSYKPNKDIIELLETHQKEYNTDFSIEEVSSEFQQAIRNINDKLRKL
jgi:hypothetical protein